MAFPTIPHTPTNPNVLHPNKFALSFSAIPTVEYWCQTVNIPGLSIGEAIRQSPFIDLYSPGDKLVINPFSMTFLVDEDLLGWREIYTWMRDMTFPKEFKEYTKLPLRPGAYAKPQPQFSDATLVVLDSKQNPKIRIKFENCFPTQLTDILLSATATPEEPITADAVFRFDLYEFEVLR